VSPRQVVMRDAQSYCAILLDDNNRKAYLPPTFNNTEKLSLGIVQWQEEEDRFTLEKHWRYLQLFEQLKQRS